ncbi:hypothetical protein PNEG_00691 [Pneumocystis murina B123]|uniref:PX domain-containing protein n=1 Tax=Pneumocystis murina (strain B123) TaxID=1069680 RepID=M7NUW0_PNEMU|nr:hypothetical protein PNEG_00691 [Pneumocystis murina B123]EMR11092.1 hypothetical protein PNEG_00691 [Pneumocystis murina B123]
MEGLEKSNPFFGESSQCGRSFLYESERISTLNKTDEDSTEINSCKMEEAMCCHIHSILNSVHEDPFISIVDTEKIGENAGRRFITYKIRIKNLEVRRRYSEFESLRKSLSRLFPTLIVPPIPEKHSIYLTIPLSSVKKDANFITQRKRMLQVFLNRCAFHPILKRSHVFHCFLNEDISWSQVLESPPISLLPQSVLMAPPLNPCSSINSTIYQCLPIPPSGAKLSNIHNRDEIHELGAAYNILSISEIGELASGIERFGLANDLNCHSNNELVKNLDFVLSEPLKEFTQFHEVARSRLKYRRQKVLQYEIVVNILNQNKNILDALEKSEMEAQKIESSLARLNNSESNLSTLNSDEPNEHEQTKQIIPTFIEKITGVLKGMIDVDSTTRKKNIEKIYEKISQLENALKITKKDSNIVGQAIIEEFERFHSFIRKDYCELMINIGKCYIEWAKKNIKIWEDAKCLI